MKHSTHEGDNGMRKLALVGVVAATALGAYGCATIGRNAFAQPVVTLRDVKLQGIGFTGGSFDVILSVYNPNGPGSYSNVPRSRSGRYSCGMYASGTACAY